MKYAVVGTGWITRSFIAGASLTKNMTLSAIYSRTEQRGREFAEECGANVPIYTNLSEMAKHSGAEGVYIASPNSLHYEQSKLFLDNGLHVLCEKPITVTSAQLRELSELARNRGLVYAEAILMMHLPAREIIKQAMHCIGKISTAHFDFSQLSSKHGQFKAGELPNIFNLKMATGCLMDLGLYCVYAAIDLFGRPKKITSSAGFLSSGADGYGSAILDYSDKQVTLTYSKTGESRAGSEILGDEGTITMESVSRLANIHLITKDNKELLFGEISKADLMSYEAAAFANYAADVPAARKQLDMLTETALTVCEVMEEIRRQCGIRFEADK